jgi:hypothetical protein
MISRRMSATRSTCRTVEPKIAKCLRHVVDVDMGADQRVLLQVPDVDGARARRVEHDMQLVG